MALHQAHSSLRRAAGAALAAAWLAAFCLVPASAQRVPLAPQGDAVGGLGVHMGTGHAYESETDVHIPITDGHSLTVSRVHSSRQISQGNDDGDTMFGVSWWSNLDMRVSVTATTATWWMANGELRSFTGSGWGHYSETDEGGSNYRGLTTVVPGMPGYSIYRITAPDRSRYSFQSDMGPLGYGLIEIRSDMNHSLYFNWDSGDPTKLDTITSSVTGRYLEFSYKTATNQIEEIRLKSSNDGGLNKLLVTYNYGNASGPYVPDANIRSVEFPNGLEKRFAYGSYDLSGSWTHDTHADDNTEPSRTICEKSIYYYNGSSWVDEPLYRASWHEHSEGYSSADSEAWIEKQYLWDVEGADWGLAWGYDWTLVGNGTSEPYHAEGGDARFEDSGTYFDYFEVDDQADATAIDHWYNTDVSDPDYAVTRRPFRSVDVVTLPPGYSTIDYQDSDNAYNESGGGSGDDHYAFGALTGAENWLGHQTSVTLLPYYGVPTVVTDMASNDTLTTYTGVTGADPGAIRPSVMEDMHARQTLLTWGRYGVEEVEDDLSNSTYTTYKTSGDWKGSVDTVTTTEGIVNTNVSYNARGQLLESSSSTGVTMDYTYTETNVPWSVLESVENNLSQVTSFEYDYRGLRTRVEDPLTHDVEFVYDRYGRVLEKENGAGDSVFYEYDLHGRLVKYTDERGLETAYAYDAAGRLTTVTYEDATTVEYAYDGGPCGCSGGAAPPTKPTEVTTRAGLVFAYEYDPLGRLLSIEYPSASRTVDFAYDYNATTNKYAALSAVTDSNFATGWHATNWDFEYEYDAYGRLLSERYPDGNTIDLAYDGENRLEDIAFNASSHVVTWSYDSLGRLSTVENGFSQDADFAYHTASGTKGLLNTITYSNGVVTSHAYDALRRLGAYEINPASGSDVERSLVYNADGTIEGIYFDYNAAVNPASFTGTAWQFAYDANKWLTQEKKVTLTSGSVTATAFTQNYAFDVAGNREERIGSGTGYKLFDEPTSGTQYNDLNQLEKYQYWKSNDVRQTFDDNGNLLRRTDYHDSEYDWVYDWSADNRLTRVRELVGGTVIVYKYDHLGRLLERHDQTSSSNGPKRRYYYFGLAPLAERKGTWGGSSYSWSNDVYNTLAPGDLGQVVIRRTDVSGSPVDKFLHYDHIGNVLSETTTAGAVSVTHEYDAYGRPVLSSAAGWAGNSLHITTKPYDAETGLFYFWQRWYDPQTGLFLSEAPMGRDAEHPYGFVENGPLTKADSRGNFPLVPLVIIWALWEGSEAVSDSLEAKEATDNCKSAMKAYQDLLLSPGKLEQSPYYAQNLETARQEALSACYGNEGALKKLADLAKHMPKPGSGGPGPSPR